MQSGSGVVKPSVLVGHCGSRDYVDNHNNLGTCTYVVYDRGKGIVPCYCISCKCWSVFVIYDFSRSTYPVIIPDSVHGYRLLEKLTPKLENNKKARTRCGDN